MVVTRVIISLGRVSHGTWPREFAREPPPCRQLETFSIFERNVAFSCEKFFVRPILRGSLTTLSHGIATWPIIYWKKGKGIAGRSAFTIQIPRAR